MKGWVAILLGLCVACSADAVTVQTRAFDHPVEVAFVCFDLQPESGPVTAVPLDACGPRGDGDGFALHALVAQKARGEVAAVDLEANEILDNDDRVPGFTFVPVGELPVDIEVPRIDPSLTYVADLGSLDVRVIPTREFRSNISQTEPAGLARIPLPAAPIDLTLSPDEDRLFVAMPGLGAIASIDIPVGEGTDPLPTLIVLGADVPEPVPAEPPETPYCKVCPGDRAGPNDDGDTLVPCEEVQSAFPRDETGAIAPLPPRDPVFAGMTPQPTHMVVVPATATAPARLLVADRALPIIHVVNLDDPSVAQPPIAVGVPTERLAITPPVPATIDDTSSLQRFLYAIDATDGSVLAVRYDEDMPSASAVLPVSVRGDADRIGFSAPARAIEVITPGFLADRIVLCDPADTGQASEATPARLNGVFLAAGLLDGSLAIADVYDLDAPCRGGALCEAPANQDDDQVFIQRHRPRINSLASTGITLRSPPTLSRNQSTFPVQPDGTTQADDPLRLAGVECGEGMTSVYPLEQASGDAANPDLVCVLADPWAAEAETWTAVWGGALPGTQGGRGRLSADEPATVTVEIPVCARGVLGAENLAGLPPEAPEAQYAPDRFVITGEVPPSVPEDAECRSVVEGSEADPVVLDFPIVRSERVMGPDGELQSVLTLEAATAGGVSFTQVQECYPELVSYEIRSQGAFTVFGSVTGFQHRVAADETTGVCTVDTELPAARTGRALWGVPFDNGIVRFQIGRPDDEVPLNRTDESQLGFEVTQIPGELAIPIGDSLPTVLSDVAFNEVNGNLYVVDEAFSGLVEFELSPLRLSSSFD